jgi:hypothetical protein
VELNSSDVSFVVADKQEVECQILDNNREHAGNLEFTELLSGTGFFGVFEGKLLWEGDILEYFLIHVDLNFELIGRVIGFFEWFLSAIFGVDFLFHEEVGLDHKVVVDRDVNFEGLIDSGVDDGWVFEFLEDFGDFADAYNFVLELADEGVVENQVTLYFVVDHWVED